MSARGARVLILGAGGQVGQALLAAVGSVDLQLTGLTRSEADITDESAIAAAFARCKPHLVINCAAQTDVNAAEENPEGAMAINAEGAGRVARHCAIANVPLLHLSTDYVFAGDRDTAYAEADVPSPINVYGQSKWAGEQQIQTIWPQHVIIRTSAILSAQGRTFIRRLFEQAKEKDEIPLVSDQITGPTPAHLLAATLLIIAGQLNYGKENGFGLFHYAGQPPVSFYGLAKSLFEAARPLGFIHPPALVPAVLADFPQKAMRPRRSILNCDKMTSIYGLRPPDWRRSLTQLLEPLGPLALMRRRP